MNRPGEPVRVPPKPTPDETQATVSDQTRRSVDSLGSSVYKELHSLAKGYMLRERDGHTLQATALVHEAYLRLAAESRSEIRSRSQFLRLAAQAMRRILTNHARDRCAAKRGGNLTIVPLEVDMLGVPTHEPEQLLAIEAALEQLEKIDQRKGEVVELRFFAGQSLEETAETLGISVAQVKRDWAFARAWLSRALQPEAESNG